METVSVTQDKYIITLDPREDGVWIHLVDRTTGHLMLIQKLSTHKLIELESVYDERVQ